MRSVWALARTTLIEQLRNRLYLVALFFGGILLLASALLGQLAPNYSSRVILDMGLLALEFFGLAAAVFGAVSLVLQEVESKTIYLILSRPVYRPLYIIGRFLGLMGAVVITMVAMAMFHVLVMKFQPEGLPILNEGWSFWETYLPLVFMSALKVMVTTALAVFFSLFATSQVSALVFTAGFWIAGHFGPEIQFLLNKSVTSGGARTVAQLITSVIPNFQYLNFRDQFSVVSFQGLHFMGWAIVYSFSYAAFSLALASLLFSKKEF